MLRFSLLGLWLSIMSIRLLCRGRFVQNIQNLRRQRSMGRAKCPSCQGIHRPVSSNQSFEEVLKISR